MRVVPSIAICAAVLSMTAGAAFADVELRVANLARPDGRQTAVLKTVLPATGTSAAVSATVAIGTRRATLTGRVMRDGRLRATGRGLALANLLQPFDGVDVIVHGGASERYRFEAAGCTRESRGRRLDCVGATSVGTLVDGVYDVVLTVRTPPGTTESARLRTFPDGTRSLAFGDGDLASGDLQMASDGTLFGQWIVGGDIVLYVNGSAIDLSTAARSRLDGVLQSSSSFIDGVTFKMERDVAGTPSALGGVWQVRLQGGGFTSLDATMTLTLAVPPDGIAPSAPTAIVRADQTIAYTVSDGTCDVAPQGGMYCYLPIPGFPQAIRLHGMLDAAAGTGAGEYSVGGPPAIESEGVWTATR